MFGNRKFYFIFNFQLSIVFLDKWTNKLKKQFHKRFLLKSQVLIFNFQLIIDKSICFSEKVFGQLVLLGYDIAAFTPVAYQRCSLQRP